MDARAIRGRDLTSVRHLFRKAVRAVFVVPDVQVHQLDLEFQYYAFHLFHQSLVNRLAHVIGLPLTIASIYAVAPPWLAWTVLAYVTGVQLALAIRHRLPGLALVVLVVNGLLWLAGRDLLQPLGVPTLLPFVTAIIPYLGHAAEPWIPPPFSRSRSFVSQDAWIAARPWKRLLLGAVCTPAHVVVEAISGPRNVFVLLVLAARAVRLAPAHVDALGHRVASVAATAEPPLTRAGYHSVLGQHRAGERTPTAARVPVRMSPTTP